MMFNRDALNREEHVYVLHMKLCFNSFKPGFTMYLQYIYMDLHRFNALSFDCSCRRPGLKVSRQDGRDKSNLIRVQLQTYYE